MEPNSLLGQDLGGYRLTGLLGVGASAWVFRAESTFDSNIVRALKVILPTLSGEAEFQKRFAEEARNLDRLRHPGIVRFYGARSAVVGQSALLVMELELLEGHTLRRYATRDRISDIPLRRAVRWVREAAEAVSIAHQMGIVHRDLKPDNLQLTPSGQIKVLDFGLARAVDDTSRSRNITMQGSIPGTVAYMAPEVCRGNLPTVGADVYALGIVLFELITGKHPFSDQAGRIPEGVQMALAQLDRPAPPVTQFRPEVPSALSDCVARAMAKSPSERYADAEQFATALRALEPLVAASGGVPSTGAPMNAGQASWSTGLPQATSVAPMSPYATSQISMAQHPVSIASAATQQASTRWPGTDFHGPAMPVSGAPQWQSANGRSGSSHASNVMWVPIVAFAVAGAAAAAALWLWNVNPVASTRLSDASTRAQSAQSTAPSCVRQCNGVDSCGDDACGGTCGMCAPSHACVSGRCVCIPQCQSGTHPCGTNGCPGSDPNQCGVCSNGWMCRAGQCELVADGQWKITVEGGQFRSRSDQSTPSLAVFIAGAWSPRQESTVPFWQWHGTQTFYFSQLQQGVNVQVWDHVHRVFFADEDIVRCNVVIQPTAEQLWMRQTLTAECEGGDVLRYILEPAAQ